MTPRGRWRVSLVFPFAGANDGYVVAWLANRTFLLIGYSHPTLIHGKCVVVGIRGNPRLGIH